MVLGPIVLMILLVTNRCNDNDADDIIDWICHEFTDATTRGGTKSNVVLKPMLRI